MGMDFTVIKWPEVFCWFIRLMRSKKLMFYLCSLLTQGLAGIQPINIPGIQNVRCFVTFLPNVRLLLELPLHTRHHGGCLKVVFGKLFFYLRKNKAIFITSF